MNMTKHVGKISNTDTKIAVVYMQIPNDDSHSLVVETDYLPDIDTDFLSRVLASKDALAETNLADLLSRSQSPSPGMDLLSYFHLNGRLRRVPVTSVIMYPYPNQPFPLEKIIEMNGGVITGKTAPAAEVREKKFNPYEEKEILDKTQSMLAMATNKLKEAELLEQEANKKREEAYRYFPQLRPGFRADVATSLELRPEQDTVTVTEEGISEEARVARDVILEEDILEEPSVTSRRGRKKKE